MSTAATPSTQLRSEPLRSETLRSDHPIAETLIATPIHQQDETTPDSISPEQQQPLDPPPCPPGNLFSDEPPLESSLHLQQIILLLQCLNWLWKDRQDYFAAGNLTIYYSPNQKKSEFFRGPDFFVVRGVEKRERRSWTLWDEDGQYPHIIIELLSSSTAAVDRGEKKTIYSQVFRTPDYFWFDPHGSEFQGFHLVDGAYQALEPNEAGHLWSQQLGLFLGIEAGKLRFFTPEGQLVPTPEESAEAESQRAEAESQRAEAESQRAEAESQRAEAESQRAEAMQQQNEQLLAKLRSLGIEPD